MSSTTGQLLSGAGAPTLGLGAPGDHYRNTSNQDLWFRENLSWELVGNLRDDAPDGIGTIWLKGSGTPSNLVGDDGNYYRNTDTQDVWEKVGGVWYLNFSFRAPGGGVGVFRRPVSIVLMEVPPGGTVQGTVVISKSFKILSLRTSAPCRLRLYPSLSHREADLLRAIGVAPAEGHGLILEAITAEDLLELALSPQADGCSLETPVGSNIPYVITNPQDTPADITVTLIYLPLEV